MPYIPLAGHDGVEVDYQHRLIKAKDGSHWMAATFDEQGHVRGTMSKSPRIPGATITSLSEKIVGALGAYHLWNRQGGRFQALPYAWRKAAEDHERAGPEPDYDTLERLTSKRYPRITTEELLEDDQLDFLSAA